MKKDMEITSDCCDKEILGKDKYGIWIFWCSNCGNECKDRRGELEEQERLKRRKFQ